MRIANLLQGLKYIGEAEGDRSTYHVFGGNSGYIVVAPGGRGGYMFGVVDQEAPDVISRRFHGQRVTRRMVSKQSRRPDLFSEPFSELNSLYVMVALGKARKLKKREGRAMVFKIR